MNNSRFKIGDMVRIRSNIDIHDEDDNLRFLYSKLKGMTGEVIDFDDNDLPIVSFGFSVGQYLSENGFDDSCFDLDEYGNYYYYDHELALYKRGG